jgi:hypothetical protein
MNARQYFTHARSLAAFRAEDALALAREAAELDRIAAAKRVAPPAVVSYEVLPDATALVNLSFGIKVF